jgi:pentatricopeptide repeat protein
MLTRRYFLLPAGMLALANFCSFALVEWKLIARHNALKKDSLVRNPLFLKTNDNDPAGPPSRNAKNYNAKKRGYLSKSKARRSERNQSNSTESISRSKAVNTVLKLQNPMKINRWLRLLSNEKNFKLDSWSTRDQIEFVKVLKERKAYDAIMMFLDFGKPDVKVFTTATFSMALSQKHRDKAFEILNKMDECSVEPTALTVIAILGSLDGPSDVSNVMKDMDNRGIVMNAEVFNSAMYAIRRVPRGSKPDANDWQVALNLFQKMRSKRIQPTSKTYHAILQVLGRTGKVTMAKSLLQQWKSSANSLQTDDYVWLAAISVCAQAADHEGAIRLITDMQEVGCTPTLRHSSALLKTFSRAGRDDLALMTLQMMLGENHFEESKRPTFTLPCVPPDLIALNTIMKACAKANNFESALSVFRRIQAGEFTDPTSSRVIAPDQITFHSMLGACHDSKVAKDIVREVRVLSVVDSLVINVIFRISQNTCYR